MHEHLPFRFSQPPYHNLAIWICANHLYLITLPCFMCHPQVIFSEQLKLRNGMSRFTSCGKEGQPPAEPPLPREPTAASPQSTDTPERLSAHQQPMLENANRLEIRALQRELAAVRATCRELAKEQTVIQGQVYFPEHCMLHYLFRLWQLIYGNTHNNHTRKLMKRVLLMWLLGLVYGRWGGSQNREKARLPHGHQDGRS